MVNLVTGGAGFIGSHLCERLIKSGQEVISIDNYSTGSKENHIKGVRYYTTESGLINELLTSAGEIKTVYHLGEYSRVEKSLQESDKVIELNYSQIGKVLKFCRIRKAKLVYAGSSTKFSDASSPYIITKALNTQLVDYYMKLHSLDYVITYFYNVYGDREIKDGDYATVVAKFLDLKRSGKIARITKPGTQTRNFTHVDDIVTGLILAAEKGHGDNYGIGAQEAYSIIDLADMIGIPYELIDSNPANRLDSQLITENIKALGWKQKHNLKEYIEAEIAKINGV